MTTLYDMIYWYCIKEKGVKYMQQQTIYISEDDEKHWDELRKIANKKDRSLSYLVNEVVKQYVNQD